MIKIYMNLVVRNQGTESAIDSSEHRSFTAISNTLSRSERSLNAAQRGPHNPTSGNLLNDREIIRRGGETKEGWLPLRTPKIRPSLFAMRQTPIVEISYGTVPRSKNIASSAGLASRSK